MFYHQLNCLPKYNLNFVEIGVRHPETQPTTYKWANWTIVNCHHVSFIGQRFKIDSYLFNFILGSTTICDSVQNEVEPRGIEDGTMVVDNLRRQDNRPPSLRSVSS